MGSIKSISTTALSKALGIQTNDLFNQLTHSGLIKKEEGEWKLTNQGTLKGGAYQVSKQYGKYIVWPENIELDFNSNNSTNSNSLEATLTASAIGKHFELSPRKTNSIFSELGWIKKALKGWELTGQGRKLNGLQSEDSRSGIPYVRWPAIILESKPLIETAENLSGKVKKPAITSKGHTEFRETFVAKHRTTDGHFVRSKAEMLIDNWLYMAEIVHAYERKLPIEEDVYSDFYIPTGKVYIEYWGLESDPKYKARKQKKIEIYNKYGFNLIELQDKEVQNLDDFLPRLLLKFGVQSY